MQEFVPRYVKILKALACKTRLDIVLELLKDPKCATDISSCINKDISTISRHLKILENAGIVDVSKEGKKIMVKLRNPLGVKMLFEALNEMTHTYKVGERSIIR